MKSKEFENIDQSCKTERKNEWLTIMIIFSIRMKSYYTIDTIIIIITATTVPVLSGRSGKPN